MAPRHHLLFNLLLIPPLGLALMFLLAGHESIPQWPRFGLSLAVSFTSLVLFSLCLPLRRSLRSVPFLFCFSAAALAPALIPLPFTPLRFLAALLSIAILLKLYDFHQAPNCFRQLNLPTRLTYPTNWFWLVCSHPPLAPPARDDVRRALVSAPLTLIGFTFCAFLFTADWSHSPFLIEHCIKVLAVFFAAIQIARTSTSIYRLTGGRAHDLTHNPFLARTPADFWRRWNRPVWIFLQTHIFKPLRGRRRPIPATLAAFVVSGIVHEYVFGIAAGRIVGTQMLFFLLQGLATLLTLRLKPRTPLQILFATTLTLTFNLATALLFFHAVNLVLPFYHPR